MKKKLWGGRFGKLTVPLAEEFSRSVHYDHKLAEYDLVGSMAHVKILKKAGYLTASEADGLHKGLLSLYEGVKKGSFLYDPESEDIHTDIQNKLEKKIGSLAMKLHTARSRNDQVVFATKLYCKKELGSLTKGLSLLISSVGSLCARDKGMIIPGFTHMQHAQPVYLTDHLMAYVKMLERDKARLAFLDKEIILTMGSGAMAGTPVKALLYDTPLEGLFVRVGPASNSLDSVSDRDFVIEILSALAIIGMHLSRMAEDLIIWSTKEFGFVELDESYCTGSSLMPQKKNPDMLELARGCSGRLYGNLMSVLVTMKGLPLTYNRDMQMDKEPLFDSCEKVSLILPVLAGLMKGLKFNKAKIREALDDESLYATDLVYYLVNKNVPFKEAHTIVGKLVKYSVDNGIEIKDMPQSLLQKFSKKLMRAETVKLFDPEVSVRSKHSIKR